MNSFMLVKTQILNYLN